MIRTGLMILLHKKLHLLNGRRVGLVTHPAAVLPDLTGTADALLRAGVQLVALFGPEHGLSGAVADGATVADGVDPRTGLPVYSLYGEHKTPTPEMLKGVDVLIFDMQDVGVRFYTYLSTLFYVLKGAVNANKPVIVLDRPNPINGITQEGPLLAPEFTSFVGTLNVVIRHGLTMGELAQYINAEYNLNVDLTVIPMQGWQRAMWFDETGLPWVPTSPAMPHLSTTTVYPGMCFLEGTNVSEGRGTALPFEICGAPWIDGQVLADALNAQALPGARFRPTHFVPSDSKYKGELCSGIQIHVTDRNALRPVTLGLHLLATLHTLYPETFTWLRQSWEGAHPHIDLLLGTDQVRGALDNQTSVDDIVASWEQERKEFTQTAALYHLYT
ncbi:MAG: DUF1343 domain-containing protein [Anaerolineae bacterium]|nr:DUF1343 domain-containing protein [Anaerolineae bacterium]